MASENDVGSPSERAEPGPEPNRKGWRWLAVVSWTVTMVTAICVGLYLFQAVVWRPKVPVALHSVELDASPEWQLHEAVEGGVGSDNLVEWRATRSTHKLIAYAIARCRNVDLDAMPVRDFRSLMLDLTPNGDHFWKFQVATGIHDVVPASDADRHLSNYDSAILSLSDSISRARLAAAIGADSFYPDMAHYGWAAVVVSAFATAVVTLKASYDTTTKPKLSLFIGFLAVFSSLMATILTGAKQFWDPTNAYMRNETALLALKQLHEEVALTFVAGFQQANCGPNDDSLKDQGSKFSRWRSTLVSLQSGTMLAPVIVSTQNGILGQNASLEERAFATPVAAYYGDAKSDHQKSGKAPPR